jgi:hypothetical protein
MPVTLERVPNEPVVIATLQGFVNIDTIKEMYSRSTDLARDIAGPWYRLTDVTNISTSFMEVLKVVREASRGLPGTSSDPNVTVVLVGTNEMAKLVADMLKQPQYGALAIPIFKCMEDALDYVHIDIARRQKEKES